MEARLTIQITDATADDLPGIVPATILPSSSLLLVPPVDRRPDALPISTNDQLQLQQHAEAKIESKAAERDVKTLVGFDSQDKRGTAPESPVIENYQKQWEACQANELKRLNSTAVVSQTLRGQFSSSGASTPQFSPVSSEGGPSSVLRPLPTSPAASAGSSARGPSLYASSNLRQAAVPASAAGTKKQSRCC